MKLFYYYIKIFDISFNVLKKHSLNKKEYFNEYYLPNRIKDIFPNYS